MLPVLMSVEVDNPQSPLMSTSDVPSRDRPGIVSSSVLPKRYGELFQRTSGPQMRVMHAHDMSQRLSSMNTENQSSRQASLTGMDGKPGPLYRLISAFSIFSSTVVPKVGSRGVVTVDDAFTSVA